jgi:DNA-binding XRE family transcriptional regulator
MNDHPLRTLRGQRRLTQEQLAVCSRVSAKTIHSIEAGRVRPQSETLRALASTLNCAPEDIFPTNANAPTANRGDAEDSSDACPSRESC